MISLMTTSPGFAVLGVLDAVGVDAGVRVSRLRVDVDGVDVDVHVGVAVGVAVAVAVAVGVAAVAVGAAVLAATAVPVDVAVGVGARLGFAAPGEPRSPALPGQLSGETRQFAPTALSRSGRINIIDAPSGFGKVRPPA